MWQCGQCKYGGNEEQSLDFVWFGNEAGDFALCPQCGAIFCVDDDESDELILKKLAPRRVRREFKRFSQKLIAEKEGRKGTENDQG